jgi:DNA-binding CsgD family transcriptional regulator
VDEHDHTLYYYDKEKDTVITYEELQKQYDEYISLAWKSKLEGSLIDVLQHYERAIQFNDSIQKLIQTESIYSEKNRLMKERNAQRQPLLIVGILLLLITIAGSIFFFARKRKRNIETDQQQKLRVAIFKQSELYTQILEAAKDDSINISPISHPVLWVSIQESLDELYADFTKRLLAQYPDLSETEQQICWLSKLGIQPSGIARILKLSRQAITNARSRIAKKMTSKEGQIANFDHFIEKS